KKRGTLQSLSFLLEMTGIAHYSCSHLAHNLRRLSSASKKNIRFFFFVLPVCTANTNRGFNSIPVLTKKRGTLQSLSFLLEMTGIEPATF
ncbi:MAG: hypothetical protein OXK80_01890, partial [Bdellovibrionales bacterium]|nr:hypothetical protein [Bdellovibrionales bacterium]